VRVEFAAGVDTGAPAGSDTLIDGFPFGNEFDSEPFTVADPVARDTELWEVFSSVPSSGASVVGGLSASSLSFPAFLPFLEGCWPI